MCEFKKNIGNAEINYREIFDKANDGILILNRDSGIIIDANQRAAEITGYFIAELIDKHLAVIPSFQEFVTKEEVDEKIQLTLSKGNQLFEWEVKRKDGSLHWIEVNCTAASIGGEERVIVFFHEIDKRKKAEASLQKSDANLRTIFNHTEIAFILLDKSLKILSYNEMAGRWSELSFGVRIKEGDNLISLLSKDRQGKSFEALKSVIAGNAMDHEVHYELIDGSVEWYRVRHNPVRDNRGIVIGVCISASNITARKFSDIESEKLTKDLIQHNKDLEQFAYIVSHNLRAPIANIIGLADVLYNMELDLNEEKEMKYELVASAKQLDMVIKDLNLILQRKTGENEKKEVVSFSDLVEDIQLSIYHLIRKEQMVFTFDFSQVNKMLTLKSYIYSIFFNLISNSIKYRQPQVRPIMEIRSYKKGNKITLLFKDNGLGIDLEKKGEHVFGLYKRFHSHMEGKGIGLYMVKTQVETLGGKITVKSEPNKGTEFKIEFENESE